MQGVHEPVERSKERFELCFSRHLSTMQLSTCFNKSGMCCISKVNTKVPELVSFSADLDVQKPDVRVYPAYDTSSPLPWIL